MYKWHVYDHILTSSTNNKVWDYPGTSLPSIVTTIQYIQDILFSYEFGIP